MHKYTIEEQPTEKIIFFIALISVILSPILSRLLTELITIINIPITFTITNSIVFAFFFLIVNLILGRIKWISRIFGIPCLRGKWICKGMSFNYTNDVQLDWKGTMIIEQTWSKILITLQTETSSSFSTSIIGNVKKIAGQGYLLTYIYENDPKSDQKELEKHKGVCEIRFDKNLLKAEADYFNRSRPTYGTMDLKRSN